MAQGLSDKSQWLSMPNVLPLRFGSKHWNEYNEKYSHRIHTRRPKEVWYSFLRSTRLLFAEYVVQFDFHDVIDTLSAEECNDLVETINLLRKQDVPIIGCSKGTKHIESILERGRVYQSVVNAMDGWVFTREYWWGKMGRHLRNLESAK